MKTLLVGLSVSVSILLLGGCGSKSQEGAAQPPATASQPAAQPPAGQAGQPAATQPGTQPAATQASGQPGATQPATTAAVQPATTAAVQPATTAAVQPATSPSVQPAAAAPAPPPLPPPPKKYLVPAGTTLAVRTLNDVSTKNVKNGNEFEANLENALEADGHLLARKGASVVGTVVNADQGGRVKGKASLTLTLSRIYLASGAPVPIKTNNVVQEAKSDTKKNLVRTGIMSGAGAAIGAIAGGGKGAAIGAGIGAGAGVATNVATRGPAAEVPPETVFTFKLARDLVVTEKASN